MTCTCKCCFISTHNSQKHVSSKSRITYMIHYDWNLVKWQTRSLSAPYKRGKLAFLYSLRTPTHNIHKQCVNKTVNQEMYNYHQWPLNSELHVCTSNCLTDKYMYMHVTVWSLNVSYRCNVHVQLISMQNQHLHVQCISQKPILPPFSAPFKESVQRPRTYW